MKLLSKQEINAQKGRERQQSIDEGMKLAKRVDALREAQANEEAALEKFRKETIAQVESEIANKLIEKDELDKEVRALEYRKQEALRPITIEMNELEEKKKVIEVRESESVRKNAELVMRDKFLDRKQQDIVITEKRIEQARTTANKQLQEAEKKNADAEITLKNANAMFDSLSAQCELREKNVAERERLSIEKERHLAEKEIEIKKKRKELIEFETMLNSRYQVLQKHHA